MKKVLHFLRYVKNFGLISGSVCFVKIYLIKRNLFNVKLKGIRSPFYLRGAQADRDTFDQVFLYNMYKSNSSNRNIETIVDCGANIGLTTILFKNMYPDSRIISIEPGNENFELLKKNISAYANIYPIKAGIWNKETWLDIKDEFNKGNNSLTVRETTSHQGAVKAVTIDSLMKEYNIDIIDLLKIDIEGSEKELFENENAEIWLPKTRILYIELHDQMKSGCSMSFFKAISNFHFDVFLSGDSLLCINQQIN